MMKKPTCITPGIGTMIRAREGSSARIRLGLKVGSMRMRMRPIRCSGLIRVDCHLVAPHLESHAGKR